MSNLDHQDAEAFVEDYLGEEPQDEAGAVSDDLKSILKLIAAQIEDSNQRHAEVLSQMQDRLQELSHEVSRNRSRVPERFAPAMERIQDGIALLAEHVAEAGQSASMAAVAEAPAAEEDAASDMDLAQIDDVAAHSEPDAEALADNNFAEIEAEQATSDDEFSPNGEVDPFEMVATCRPGNPEEPWDNASAEALTRVFEEDSGLFRSSASVPTLSAIAPAVGQGVEEQVAPIQQMDDAWQQPTPQATVDTNAVGNLIAEEFAEHREAEHQWLDERFADIAERIEHALAEMRPDDQLHALGDRFERLQEHIGETFGSLTSLSEGSGLSGAEAQIEDLVAGFNRLEQQSSRLDVIETQLQDLMGRFSDEKLAELISGLGGSATAHPDIDAIANAAAETVAARFSDAQSSGGAADTSELRGLIEAMMEERRQGDVHTSGTLETIQQAMISVLDRVEVIEQMAREGAAEAEAYGHAPVDSDFAHEPAREPVYDQAPEELGHGRGPLDPATRPDVAGQSAGSDFDRLPQDDFARENFAHDGLGADQADTQPPHGVIAPDLPPVNAIDRIRRDFIAEAQRAREKAEREAEEEETRIIERGANADEPSGRGFRLPGLGRKSSEAATPKADRHSAGVEAALAGSDPAEASTSLFGLTRRKLLVGAFVLLIATSGLLLMVPRKDATAPVAAPAAVEQPAGATDALPPGITPPEGFNQSGQSEGAPAEDAGGWGAAPADGDASLGDRSEVIEGPADGATLSPVALAKGETLPGIAIQNSRRLDPEKIAKIQERQWMAHQSSQVGAAAAKATPAALLTEYGAEQNAAPKPPVASSGMSRALDLPPATVGPLSLRLAAAKGDPSAEFEVGARLAEGRGTKQDLKAALKWYKRSASRGFAQSQYRLGTLYEQGLGVKQDNATARVWYQRAAEKGNIKAMHNLAVLSASRSQGSPDYLTAAHWFGQAAERGLADSQYNLAVLHENGLGVAKDLIQAYKYYALAANSGDAESIKRRDAIKKTLDKSQFLDAARLVAGWRNKPVDKVVNDARTAGEDWKARANNAYNG